MFRFLVLLGFGSLWLTGFCFPPIDARVACLFVVAPLGLLVFSRSYFQNGASCVVLITVYDDVLHRLVGVSEVLLFGALLLAAESSMFC